MKNNEKAFTLIELLIVVTIMGILTTLIAVQAKNAVDKAAISADFANAHSIMSAIKQAMYADIQNAIFLNEEQLQNNTMISGTAQNPIYVSQYMNNIPEPKNSRVLDKYWYIIANPTTQIVTVYVKVNNEDVILYPKQINTYYQDTGYDLI